MLIAELQVELFNRKAFAFFFFYILVIVVVWIFGLLSSQLSLK